MTDPDHCRSQARDNRNPISSVPPPPPQPNFGAMLAANIPQIYIPEIHRLPVATSGSAVSSAFMQPSGSGVSVIARPSVSDDSFRILPTVTSGIDYQFLSESNIPQVQLPPGWNAPLYNPVPLRPPSGFSCVNEIPQVQLPDNWNAPLQNLMPVVPPVPVFPTRGRGRGRGRPSVGSLYDLSGDQTNPAWNNLHSGHIVQREQAANHQSLLEQCAERYLRDQEQARQQQLEAEAQRLREEQEEVRRKNEKIQELQLLAERLRIQAQEQEACRRQNEEQQQQLLEL